MKDKDAKLLKEKYEQVNEMSDQVNEMSDQEFLEQIAKLWIELGGDSEGVAWVWKDLQQEISRQEQY